MADLDPTKWQALCCPDCGRKLKTVFVAVSAAGLLGLSGEPGLGPGFTRAALVPMLALGALAVVVAGFDLYRHRNAGD